MKNYLKTILLTTLCYLIIISMLPVASVNASAAVSYTGSGTETDPYIVSTGDELVSVLELYNTPDVYIELDNNITLDESYVPGSFKGTLDGNFYKITAATEFFYSNSGTLKNFYYVDTVVRTDGSSMYAGIICDSNSGTISGVIATGNIDCECTHNASGSTGDDAPSELGLISGSNSGTIINCGAFGSLSSYCVYGARAAGISLSGTIINCYAAVEISTSGSSRYGSSVDKPISFGDISNSYYNNELYTDTGFTNGLTTSEMKTSDFVALLNSNSANCDSKWVRDTSNKNSGYPILTRALNATITSSKSNILIDGTESITLTCSDPASKIYYTLDGSTPTASSRLYSSPISISSETIIKAVAYKNSLYSTPITFRYAKVSGAGTVDSPYVINSEASLNAVTELENDAYYILSNNINLIDEMPHLGDFYGVFDGQGYTIGNVYTVSRINGIFDENYGIIQNLNLQVKSNDNFVSNAGIVVNNYGVIYNCNFNGYLEGKDLSYGSSDSAFGGIAANNFGIIEKCDFDGCVHAESASQAGGIIGNNKGEITLCSFNGDVDIYAVTTACHQGYVGGFVGYNDTNGKISYCVVNGNKVYSSPENYSGVKVGAFAGDYVSSSYITNCSANVTSVSYTYSYTEWGVNEVNYAFSGSGVLDYVPTVHNHNFAHSLNPPVCGELRSYKYECSCGINFSSKEFYDEYRDMSHDYDDAEYIITKNQTCSEHGEYVRYCNTCNYADTYDVLPSSHNSMMLVDPNLYPESTHEYENNLNETKELTYPNAKQLFITFSQKTYIAYNDYLYVYDGSGKLIDSYTSENLNNVTITVPGDTVKFVLSTDSSGTGYGYSLDYVYADCLSCEVLVDKSLYPESSHNYGNNLNQTKTFTQPGANNLKITFSEQTEVENSCDNIYIYDKNSTLIGKYTGTSLAGVTLTIPGDTLKIVLTSDGSVDKYGYSFSSIYAEIAGYGDWTVTQAPTCMEEGVKERTCSICSYVDTASVAALGHSFTNYIYDNNETYTENGTKTAKCDRCNETHSLVVENTKIAPVSIEIETLPDTLSYVVGEDVDVEGLTFVAKYADNGEYTFSAGTVESVVADTTSAGVTKATITYMGCIAEFDIYVHESAPVLVEKSLYPESSHNYANNTNQTKTFTYTGATELVVTFSSSTYVESNCDYIYIYNKNGSLYGKYTNNQLAGKTITLSGDAFKITLTSDGSTVYYGYKIDSIYADGPFAMCHPEVVIPATATCTQGGLTQGSYCEICGAIVVEPVETEAFGHSFTYYVSDSNSTCVADGTKTAKCDRCEVTDTVDDEGSMKPHDCDIVEAKTPTCTEIGWDSYETCKDCDYTTYSELPATNHLDKIFTEQQDPTCTVEGYTEGYYCPDCEIWVSGHDAIAPTEHPDQYIVGTVKATCTEDGYSIGLYCPDCEEWLMGHELLPATGHTIINHKAKAPTCIDVGWDAYETCSICDYTTYEEKTALGHIEAEAVIENEIAPDCVNDGSYDSVVYCAVCQTELSRATVAVPALGHDEISHAAQTPTCTEIGWNEYVTCSRCDYTTYEEIAENGHALVEHEAKAPTCTEIGWAAYNTCENCNYTTYEEITSSGHAFVEHEAKAPTCTDIGWDAYTSCENCDYSTYKSIAATNHKKKMLADEVEPTCVAVGYTAGMFCNDCETWLMGHVEIPAKGHRHVWVNDEQTLTKTGTCSECGDVISEAMASVDVITFTINDEGTAYTITDCLNNYEGEVEIPEEYNDLPVTAVGTAAFLDCPGISSVVIPDGVTTIGDRAFGYYNSEDDSIEKTENFVIYGEESSAAQVYAIENDIEFVLITERDKAIYGTLNTKVDFNSFMIRTTVQCGNNIKDILGVSKNAAVEINSSYKHGDIEFYGTGSVISVYDGENFIGEFTLIVDGDTNGDSVCDVIDAAQISLVVNGQNTFEKDCYSKAADANFDDVIDINDYQAIINKVV